MLRHVFIPQKKTVEKKPQVEEKSKQAANKTISKKAMQKSKLMCFCEETCLGRESSFVNWNGIGKFQRAPVDY